MIVDSGNRTEFSSGAVRDMHGEGKGRCDLMPLWVIGETFNNDILRKIGDFIYCGDPELIMQACRDFVIEYYDSIPDALLELSIHYLEGSQKYQERNWEKGIKLHSYIDSAVRHYLKFIRGDEDERHDRSFLWNLFGALWTIENKPELADLPGFQALAGEMFKNSLLSDED